MKKQLSSLDIDYLIKELKQLENTRIDKIYQPEKELVVFSLHKSSEGKKLLEISTKSIFLIEKKEEYPETLGFGQLLRKHLDGFFLAKIEQIKPERIVKIEFKQKEIVKTLYIELFGKGNFILCDANNVIINALEHHEFRDRVVRPKLKYVYPISGYNLFDVDIEEFLKKSKKDTIVTALATELGLGGTYAEELCKISGIDKNKNPGEIDALSLDKLFNRKINANVVFDNENLIDFAPFELEIYSDKKLKNFDTFSGAIGFFFSHFQPEKETDHDKRLKEIKRIIEIQKTSIDEMRKEEQELRKKGELIYENYQLVKEILEELGKASKKHPWKEIKEKLKNHKYVKELNEKDRKVVVEL